MKRTVLCILSAGVVWVGALPTFGQISVKRTIRITDHVAKQTNPSISGDIVVWEDWRNGNADIYGYDLSSSTEFPIAVGVENQTSPEITGPIVVWQDRAGGLCYRGKDLQTGSEFTVQCTNAFGGHTILGREVFCAAETGTPNRYRIHRYNVDSDVLTQLSPEDGNEHMSPSAKDGYVAWYWSAYDALLMNLQTSALTEISRPGGTITEPAVADNRVFFSVLGSPGAGIEYYDILTGTISTVPGTDSNSWHPSADDSIVIWTDGSSVPAERLRGCDVATDQVFDVVNIPGGGILHTQQCTEIDGLQVVWTRVWDDGFTQMDVYVTELVPEPATLGLLAAGLGAVWMRKRRVTK